MSLKSLNLAFVLFAALGCAATAAAKDVERKFAADSLEAFEPQAAQVRKDMAPSGRYAGVSATDRTAIEADLTKIEDLLKAKGTASALNDRDQVELMNAQERVNALLTRNDGDRLICTMEQKTGSNFKQKVCMTAKQRDQVRQASQDEFGRSTRTGDASSTRLGTQGR